MFRDAAPTGMRILWRILRISKSAVGCITVRGRSCLPMEYGIVLVDGRGPQTDFLQHGSAASVGSGEHRAVLQPAGARSDLQR
jgi:hypothetical protein